MKILFILLLCSSFYCGLCVAEDSGPTARGMFLRLPTTIFDNTPEGMDEDEKEELLATGDSEFWKIENEDPDSMFFLSQPFKERQVQIRLFRNHESGKTIVAVGTKGDPVCALELWQVDAAWRIVPYDAPDEPKIREFFKKSRKTQNHYSVITCLDGDRLVARPLLWKNGDMMPAKTDREIAFAWNGSKFEKQISAAK